MYAVTLVRGGHREGRHCARLCFRGAVLISWECGHAVLTLIPRRALELSFRDVTPDIQGSETHLPLP